MNFLHLWAIGIGAGALAAPLAIHFLTRPKPLTHPLSTIRFLLEIIEEKRARSRLRDLLVLLLRMLAIGLLAMALARPWIDNSSNVQTVPDNATTRIVIVDVSQSMSAKSNNVSAIQQAKSAALKYLEYSPNLQANVILVGARSRPVFSSFSPNLATLRESVNNANVLCERADVKSAMTLAGSMLSQSNVQNSELIVVSDFQRTNWSNLHLDLIPAQAKVQIESVAIASQNNVAITGFRLGNRAIVDSDVMLEFDIANYTDNDIEAVATLDLGEATAEVKGKVSAQSTATLTTPMRFAQPKWVTGWVELRENSDSIPADDVRPVAFQIERPPKILLLTQSKRSNQASGGFFLDQALQVIVGAPADSESRDAKAATEQYVSLTPRNVGLQEIAAADIYVLHECGALESETVESIAQQVRRGKGLLYVASGLVDGVNLDLIATASGNGYKPPVQLVPSENDAKRADLFVRDIRPRQAPFSIFGEQAMAAMQTVRIGGGLATGSLESGLRDQVLAELSDSSAFMFLTSCDAGSVAVINADLDQSNWCSQPSFFPILNELVNALYANRNLNQEAFGGEAMVRQLSSRLPAEATLTCEAADMRSLPSTELGTWEWNAQQNGFVWAWPVPVGPGSYQLRYLRETVMATAVAAPAIESDPKTLAPEVLKGRLAGSRQIGVRDASSPDQRSDQWWNWLIVACLLGLASEIVLLRWFKA